MRRKEEERRRRREEGEKGERVGVKGGENNVSSKPGNLLCSNIINELCCLILRTGWSRSTLYLFYNLYPMININNILYLIIYYIYILLYIKANINNAYIKIY